MDCLIINSYAGSLVLGAKAAGIPIRRSMEDSGYGIAGQRLNFPDLTFIDDRAFWPKDDLRDTVVIAHPPCAAFSNMNLVKEKRGLETDAFSCHRRVLDYALGQNCSALAIESVPGALEAAGQAYADYAKRYSYGHCFVLLNAISFGVPQWRPRFWALFFRDRRTPFSFNFTPTYRNVQSILEGSYPTDRTILKHLEYHANKFKRGENFDFEAMMKSEIIGGFDSMAKKYLGVDDSEEEKRRTGTQGLYRAGLPRKLDPTLWAPVILGFSMWYVDDRPLNRIEYQRIMGFPDDYQWPEKMKKDFLTYLSKGICPPVGTWIINQMTNWEEGNYSVADGGVLDLQPQKKSVEAILRGTSVDPITVVGPRVPRVVRPSPPPDKPRLTLEEFRKRVAATPKVEEPELEPAGPWGNYK